MHHSRQRLTGSHHFQDFIFTGQQRLGSFPVIDGRVGFLLARIAVRLHKLVSAIIVYRLLNPLRDLGD